MLASARHLREWTVCDHVSSVLGYRWVVAGLQFLAWLEFLQPHKSNLGFQLVWRGFTSRLLPLEDPGFWSLASHLAKLSVFQLSVNTWKFLSRVKVVPNVGFTSLAYAFVSTTIFKFFDAYKHSPSIPVVCSLHWCLQSGI